MLMINDRITFYERLLYFGWPNQPSSGIMRICIATYAYITNICAIAELRKTKVIDSVKYEANESNKGKKLINFFANIEAMRKKCSAFCDWAVFVEDNQNNRSLLEESRV